MISSDSKALSFSNFVAVVMMMIMVASIVDDDFQRVREREANDFEIKCGG